MEEAKWAFQGIWYLWYLDILQVDVISNYDQMVHMRVRWRNAQPWFLIVVQCPQFARRQSLWEALMEVSFDLDGQWVVMGDFNCTLLPSEKVGGNSE